MNRILLACNAVLALLLAIRLADSKSTALAAEAAVAVWRAEDLRLLPTAASAMPGARPAVSQREFLLHLGAEVAVEPVRPEPVDLGLVCEPPVELATVWHATSIVKVLVQQPLLPAHRYRFRFARDLRALDGRVLPAGAAVTMTTPNVALHQVVVEDDPQALPGRGAASLRVTLDLAVPLEVAQRFLCLVDPADGARLPTRVVGVPGTGDCTFLLRRDGGELPPQVLVVLGKGLVPRGGEVPIPRDLVQSVAVYEPLALVGAQGTGDGLQLTFNRALADVDPTTVVVPAVPAANCSVEGAGLRIRGEFAPGSLVAVELAARFPGRGRSLLGASVRRTVLMPDREPSLGIDGDGEVLSARAEPLLTLRGCNVDRVMLRLRRVYDNNVVRMLQHGDDLVFEPAPAHELPIAAARNVEWQERVHLRQLLGAVPGGLYQIEYWHRDRGWPERRWLQVTDLGVTVRAGHGSAAVQVVSLADNAPVADADIEILTPTNQPLAAGRSDAEGITRLQWQSVAKDRTPFVVVVRRGEDRVFVGMQRFAVELGDDGLGGREYLRDRIEAMVWPSRGIVRPGERLDVGVLAREAGGEAAVDRQLSVAFVAPGGKEFLRQRVRTPGSGLVSAALELPLDAPCGTWSAVAFDGSGPEAIGRAAFEVATFVPNRLEAEVQVEGTPHLGLPMLVRVRGNWLDGTAAAGRPAVVRVRLLPGRFAPATCSGFSFASGRDEPPPGELPAVEGVLDDRGAAELRILLPVKAAEQVLTAVVIAEVLDPSGRPVRVQREVPVLCADFHLGVRAEAGRVELCAVDAEGAAAAAAGPVQLRVERRCWAWRYDERDGRRWAWRSFVERQVVHEVPVMLEGGRGAVDLPPLAGGGWLVAVATCGDHRAEQAIGSVPRAPDRLRVRAAAAAVAGGVAEIEVESPAAGRAFVTLESDIVHTTTVAALAAGHNRIALQVPESLRLPNLHAVVTLTRPVGTAVAGEGPAWIVGGARLPLRRDDLATAVQVQVPASVLPLEPLHVQVVAAGASQALVAVVDEGVLDVTGHGSPDPLAFHLAARRLAVSGADTGVRLIRDMVFLPRAKTGGDDDDLQTLLRGGSVDPHIRPLALFAEVSLDAEGRGRASFQLPAYEGRVRVMVLAAGARCMGGGAAPVVVKAPLGLQVAVPRMLAPEDRFVVPITLRNDLGADAAIAVEVDAPAGLHLPGGRRYEVPVALGRTATVEVVMVVAATCEGTQSLVVTATGGGAQRTVAQDLVVRTPRLPAREFVGVRLGEAQTVQVAADWAPQDLQATVVLDAAPDRQLRPALEALLEYPYGCCEQTASRGLGLATCAVLMPRLRDPGEAAPAVLPLVQAAVDRVLAMQTSRGGFGWWLGDGDDHAFVTVHAMDFLWHAREVGAEVAEAALARAVVRLQAFAATADELDLRCHAIEVLARFGGTVQPRLDWLCAQPVGAEARARLATALAGLGDRRRAAELLAHGEGHELAAGERAAQLSSQLRADALFLRARLAIDPADAQLPELVAALQQKLLHPQWLTTQEQAHALRAIADYYRRQQPLQQAPRLTLLVDGVATEVAPHVACAVAVRPGSTVRFDAGGAGFALLELRGSRPPRPSNSASVALRREVVDIDTGLPVTECRRGRVYEVRIHGESAAALADVVLVDLLPGGFEAEPAAVGAARAADDEAAGPERAVRPANLEPRDDRVLLFFHALPAGRFVTRHRVRAVFPGEYAVPPLQAQAMYDPAVAAAVDGPSRLVVLP